MSAPISAESRLDGVRGRARAGARSRRGQQSCARLALLRAALGQAFRRRHRNPFDTAAMNADMFDGDAPRAVPPPPPAVSSRDRDAASGARQKRHAPHAKCPCNRKDLVTQIIAEAMADRNVKGCLEMFDDLWPLVRGNNFSEKLTRSLLRKLTKHPELRWSRRETGGRAQQEQRAAASPTSSSSASPCAIE